MEMFIVQNIGQRHFDPPTCGAIAPWLWRIFGTRKRFQSQFKEHQIAGINRFYKG